MARFSFGGTLPDYVFNTVTVSGTTGLLHVPTGTINLTFWSAKTGGTQYTDLLLNGSAATQITMASDGTIPEFQGPDGVTTMFASAGGTRVRIVTFTNAGQAVSTTGVTSLSVNGGAPQTGAVSITTTGSGTVVDASTTAKGIVQLSGDLGGVATSPTVPGLAGKANTVHTHTVSQLSDVTLAAVRTFLQATSTANARTAINAGVDTLMTQAEANAGTDATARQISASVLKGAITNYVGIVGSVSYAQLPPGATLTFDYVRGGFGSAAGALPTVRPTARTDITVVWTVPVGTDVSAIAIPSDKVDFY